MAAARFGDTMHDNTSILSNDIITWELRARSLMWPARIISMKRIEVI
jgi:hypothetical protein